MNKLTTVTEYKEITVDPQIISILKKINKLYSKKSNEEDSVFKIYGNQIKAKQFVGVIKAGNQTIQILPKVLSLTKGSKESQEDSEGKRKEHSEIIKNLLFMLKYTKKLDLKETDLTNLKKCDDLFEVIIYLFAKNLLEQLKFDLVRNYELQEDNLPYMKGKIQFTKHIKNNLINRSKFYCEYDEFTDNNLLNQIFKATIDKLMKFTKSTDNYKLLTNCNSILSDISLKHIKLYDLDKVKFTRSTECYKPCFELAKLLLFGNSVELSCKDISTFSLLFDMNKLFEEFIFEFIKKEIISGEIGLRIESQKQAKKVFSEDKDKPKSTIGQFELRPDILIYEKEKLKLIIDTKYKILDQKYKNKGISSTDIYQMMVYGIRYFPDNQEETVSKKRIILLYPKPAHTDFSTSVGSGITDEKIKIEVKTVNLHIDLRTNKNTLKEELQKIISDNDLNTFK